MYFSALFEHANFHFVDIEKCFGSVSILACIYD